MHIEFKVVEWSFTDYTVQLPLSCTVDSLARYMRDRHGAMKKLRLWTTRVSDATLLLDTSADAITQARLPARSATLEECAFGELALRAARRKSGGPGGDSFAGVVVCVRLRVLALSCMRRCSRHSLTLIR